MEGHGELAVGTAGIAEGREALGNGGQGVLGGEWDMSMKQMKRDRWARFLSSDIYRKVVLFKLEGVKGLMDPAEDVGRNEMRVIARKVKNFVLGEGSDCEEGGRLFFLERDGRMAACILEEQIDKALAEAHDAHGHFAHGITAG